MINSTGNAPKPALAALLDEVRTWNYRWGWPCFFRFYYSIIFIRESRRFLSKQGQPQPHLHPQRLGYQARIFQMVYSNTFFKLLPFSHHRCQWFQIARLCDDEYDHNNINDDNDETINVADDGGADTDDDNNYKYKSISEQQCWHSRWSPPKRTHIQKGWIPRWSLRTEWWNGGSV